MKKFLSNNLKVILKEKIPFFKLKNTFFSHTNIFKFSSIKATQNNFLFQLPNKQFAQQDKTYKDILKDYDKNRQLATDLINVFMKDLSDSTLSNEDKIFSKLEEINNVQISLFEFNDFKQKIIENIDKFVITKNKSFSILFGLFDKLEIDENLDKTLTHLSKKITQNIKSFDSETLSIVIYTFSKTRIKDDQMWELFEKTVTDNLSDKFDIKQLSQILISFTMVNHKNRDFYKKVMSKIEQHIDKLYYLDTSRICFSLSRGIIPLNEISEGTFKKLQENFCNNISQFNLFQMSKILLLFSELPLYSPNLYLNAETEITKEYLNQIDEIVKENPEAVNLTAFFDDLSTSMLTFSIKRKGSKFFWTSYLKCVEKLKKSMSIETLENLLFITVQVAEMQNIIDYSKDPDLNNVVDLLKTKILVEKLLPDNKINPFNLMMTLSTLRIDNNELWGNLIVNVLKALKHVNFKMNAYILSDLVYGFGTYETALIINNKPHELYENNSSELWNLIEKQFNEIKVEQYDVLQISNISWYFSQIGFGSKETWENIQKLILIRINDFDQYNYLLVCMAISAMDIVNPDLWRKLEEKGLTMINNFNLEDLRKLIFAFLKAKECKNIWTKIEEVLATDKICAEYNLTNFSDLQLPLAVIEIKNIKIWQKFEEVVFKNLKNFENDNDLLMNTVYAFSKVGQGSKMMWDKFTSIIKERMEKYDADDLGHIAVCLNKIVDDKTFWDKFLVCTSKNLPNSKINSCNNLLKGFNTNKYLKDNTVLIKKIEDRIQELLKEIKK